MGTYDGYWEMNNDPNYFADRARYESELEVVAKQYSGTGGPSTPPKEKQEVFQPITARYGKNEWRMAKQGVGADIHLQAGGQDFTANKIMLMAHSQFFRTMFTRPWKEATDPHAVVELKDIDPGIFKCLLKFMYTGTLSKKTQAEYAGDFSKLASLLTQGDFLGLDGIGIWASEFLQRTLVGKNEIPDHVYTVLFEIALRSSCDELLDVLIHHAAKLNGRCTRNSALFLHAVGEASINELISKEMWEKIKQKERIGLASEILRIEECNPYIRRLLTR